MQLCRCRQNVARMLALRLQADFEANSIVCSPLLWRIIRLETQTFGPLIKVSNQNKVIWRQIPPAPTVMESVIAVFVIIVSLIANDAVFALVDLFEHPK